MSVEQKGPGNVSNAYGARTTVSSASINTGIPKDIYTGFNTDPVTPGSGGTSARVVGSNVTTSGSGSVNKNNYIRTKTALANLKSGTSYMKIARVGDSTEMGVGALGTGSLTAGTRAVSATPYFAAAMNSKQYPTVASSFVSDNNSTNGGSNAAAYDPRIFLGSGWASTSTTSTVTVGGNLLANTTTANSLGFLPFELCDTFEVYYATGPTLGSFTLSRTGDTTSPTIDSATTAGVGKYVFTGALGNTAAINVQRVAGGVYIIGVDAYNSQIKSARVFNLGWSGGKMSDWIRSDFAYGPLPALQSLGCQLTIVSTGINEWYNSVPVATYQANLDSYVASILVNSDVILATGYPSQNSVIALAAQKPYIDAIYAVALKYGLIVNDVWQKVGTWEQANLFGYAANNLHYLKEMYRLRAEADASIVNLLQY